MTYRCTNCGSKESFIALQSITEYRTETIVMDSEGQIDDLLDSECDDYRVDEGPYDIECRECGSYDVEIINEQEQNSLRRIVGNLNVEE